MNKKVLLGVDPGRAKTGVALMTQEGKLVNYAVLLTENFCEELSLLLTGLEPQIIVLGNGTTSTEMQETLEKLFPTVALVSVEEGGSTQEARKLYWEMNPPTGWRKLLPLGLLVPPGNLDGLAAVVLLQRYLAKKLE